MHRCASSWLVRAILPLAAACLLAWPFPAEAQTVKVPSRFLPGDAAIAPAFGDQGAPYLAQGGTTLLAVWEDNRANSTGGYEGETSWDIYGMRIDGEGNLLETVPFAIAAGRATQENPRAAWNGTNWLVVYETYDVNGTGGYYDVFLEAVRVAPDGRVLDARPIRIHNITPVGATWAVASDGSGWVIAAQGVSVDGDLGAVRISGAGALLDPAPRILVPATYYLRGGFHLAYAGGIFMLVYEESMTGHDPASAIRFDAALNPVDPAPYNLAPAPLARLVSNGSAIYAVWNEQLPDFTMAVKGSRIGADGRKADGGGVNISAANQPTGGTSLAWDGTAWKVTWSTATGTRVARVSAGGQVLDPGGVVVAGAATGLSASAGNGSLQLVRSDYASGYDVFTTRISAANAAGPSRALSVGAPAQMRAAVAAGGAGFMVVYRSSTAGRTRILAQALDTAGNPLTTEPVELQAVDVPASLGYPAVAWNGSVFLATWSNAGGVVVRRLQADGTPIDPAPLVVMSPGFGPADVAALGTDFLVVGLRCGINCQYVFPIAIRVRGSDAAVLDTSPIVMGGTFCSNPRLAVLGGRWLLVWQANATHDECYASTLGTFIDAAGVKAPEFTVHGPYSSCGGNGIFSIGLASSGSVALMVQSQELTSGVETDLLARRIEADGTVRPYANITPWAGDQYRPRVAWDGARFVVVWQDQKVALDGDWGLDQLDARSDLMGMRISTAGVPVDPQGFVVSNSPIGEAYPEVAAGGGVTLVAASLMRNDPGLANYRIGYGRLGDGANQWPVAVASVDPTGGDVPIAVAFSSLGSGDPDGPMPAALWDFGDGVTSAEPFPFHMYTTGGPYVATLTLTDAAGARSTQELLVDVLAPNLPPVAVATAGATHGPTPFNVVFSAAGSYDPDGVIGNIHWEASDGSQYWGSPAYFTFYDAGPVQVTLTVYDGRGGTGTTAIGVTVDPPLPPAAPGSLSAIAFTSDWINMTWTDDSNNEDGFQVERCAGTQAYCDASPGAWSLLAQVGRNIDYYGDTGLPSLTTYSYRVRAFNVTAVSGYSNTSTATTMSAPPVADMAPSVLNGPGPLVVQFDGGGSFDPDGTIVAWAWDFSDGATATGPVAAHVYAAEGTYWPMLTVTDSNGLTNSVQRAITVVPGNTRTAAAADAATASGTITSGSYDSTRMQDDVAEVIAEVRTGGGPQTRTTLLDHTWRLDVPPGAWRAFYVDAWHSANGEGDDFRFSYSRDNVTWAPMLTITRTADADSLQSFAFPEDVTGTLWINVRDLDRGAGHGQVDTISIDEMFVTTSQWSGQCGEVMGGAPGEPGAGLVVSSATGGALRLDWGTSCGGGEDDYAVYEGPIGDFTAHVPVVCSTGGARTATFVPAPVDTYYLIVPLRGHHEGRYGMSTAGAEVPAGPTRCYPEAPVVACP